MAEAKCLIAARYFDMFRHYGGLPLLYASFTGTESGYEIPRATVEETVNYMIKMLDDAINSGGLVWAYADADLASEGRTLDKGWCDGIEMQKSGNLPLLRCLTMSTDMQEETQRLNSNVWYGTAAIVRSFGITV